MMQAELVYKRSATSATDGGDLIMQGLPQVYYIAARIYERLPKRIDMEDLVSAGVLGLIEAARSFDQSKNVQFNTFATYRIRGAILDSLRESDWGSRNMRRKKREIAEVSERLESRLGRHPVEAEIAAEMDLDPEQLWEIKAKLNSLQIAGQQTRVSKDGSRSLDLIESAPSVDYPDAFDLCLEGEMKVHLVAAISKLSEREQLILSLYYREELTMREIAAVVGVAISRVSQIMHATVLKLRTSLKHVQKGLTPVVPVRGEYFERFKSK